MPGWIFSGSRPTFTFKGQSQNGVSGGAAHLTVPTNVIPGDVLFFANYGSSGGAVPGPVTFPGFNPVISTSIVASGSDGSSLRLTGQYRLCDGSEAGVTYYGMNGSKSSGLIMLLFTSTTSPFGTLTPAGISQQTVRNHVPSPQTIPCASQVLPVVAFAMDRVGQSNAALSMTPTDGLFNIGGAGFGCGFKIFNSNPTNVSVSCPNSGFENSLASFFLIGDV